ncbi:uncharacterized protein KZ484_026596 isoform 2-T2 [Pholidichthys leucotaenia]
MVVRNFDEETTNQQGIEKRHLTAAHLNHLKMTRLLFLCLLLLLPAAAAVYEGSAGDELDDDEDNVRRGKMPITFADKTTGVEDSARVTLIVIIVAATVLALSVAAVVTIIVIRRKMHSRQQGIYSVPTEQDQKGAI